MTNSTDDKKPGLQREDIEKYVYKKIHLDDEIEIYGNVYTVYKFYPNFVMCKNVYGESECFQYVDILNSIGTTVETVLQEFQNAS